MKAEATDSAQPHSKNGSSISSIHRPFGRIHRIDIQQEDDSEEAENGTEEWQVEDEMVEKVNQEYHNGESNHRNDYASKYIL